MFDRLERKFWCLRLGAPYVCLRGGLYGGRIGAGKAVGGGFEGCSLWAGWGHD